MKIIKKYSHILITLYVVTPFLCGCHTSTEEMTCLEVGEKDPVVALEWNQIAETYIQPGFSRQDDQVAIDYEVTPIPSTEEVQITYNFDPLNSYESFTETGCLSGVSFEKLLQDKNAQEVVVAEVSTVEREGDSRIGRLYIPTGDRTITIQVPENLGNDTNEQNKPWYVVFEPAHGLTRIAIVPLDPTNSSIEINNMPSGPATIAIISTSALQNIGGTLYGLLGFSDSWRNIADRRFEVLDAVAHPTDEMILRPILTKDNNLTKETILNESTISLGDQTTQLEIGDSQAILNLEKTDSLDELQITLGSFSEVTFEIEGEPYVLNPDHQRVTITKEQLPKDGPLTLDLEVQSLNGRTTRLYLAETSTP